MSKRYFKIDTGRYGGEAVVGTVSREFAEYWADKDSDDLVLHIQSLEWGDDDDDDTDPDSPEMTEDGNCSWFDIDDIDRANGPYADSEFSVTEIELHPDAELEYDELTWKPDTDHEYNVDMYTELTEPEYHNYSGFVYGREAYNNVTDNTADLEPVLAMHCADKGLFGELFIVTDGEDFDPEKLHIGVLETSVAEIIEAYWYDGVAVGIDWSRSESTGKGVYANVGFMNLAHHDDPGDYTVDSDIVKEYFEMLEGEAE